MTLATISDIRDIVIIITGLLGIVSLTVFLILTIVLGWLTFRLLRSTRTTLRDGVPPLLDQARETMHSVKGTADFLGESAAAPVIRAYGVVSGIQRALQVLGRRSE